MDLNRILQNYDLPKTVMGAVLYGQGHINDTFCVVCQPQEGDCIRYILQGMSTVAFKEPEKLMDNFIHITDYLGQQIRDAGGDPYRETLSTIKTKDHRNYVTDENGKLWRLMPFIEKSCKKVLADYAASTNMDIYTLKIKLKDSISRAIFDKTRRSPIVIVTVLTAHF